MSIFVVICAKIKIMLYTIYAESTPKSNNNEICLDKISNTINEAKVGRSKK